jgi:TMEM175 potassium channel family protein
MVRRVNPPDGEPSEREMGRLEAFSDGVFAIAITLLILEIAIPLDSPHLGHDLLDRWPSFLAYAISFMVILIMWVNHHMVFKLIDRSDRRFLIINGILLMLITFVNYPTALLADYLTTSQSRTAMLVYSGTFVVVALSFNLLWRYASYNRRLLSDSADPDLIAAISRAFRFGPLMYFAAFVAAFVYVPLSIAISAGLAIYYAVYGLRGDNGLEPEPEPAPVTSE